MTFVPASNEQYITVDGYERPISFAAKFTYTRRLNSADEFSVDLRSIRLAQTTHELEIETPDDTLAQEMFEIFASGAKNATITLKRTTAGWINPLYEGWRQPSNLREFWALLKDIARYTWREAVRDPLPRPVTHAFYFTNMHLTFPQQPPMLDFRTMEARQPWPNYVRFES